MVPGIWSVYVCVREVGVLVASINPVKEESHITLH